MSKELNREIYVKIFGAKWMRTKYGYRVLLLPEDAEIFRTHYDFTDADGTEKIEETGLYPTPDYCNDIAEAWKVVEEFRRRWQEDGDYCWEFLDCKHGWQVSQIYDGGGSHYETICFADGETLPLAIVKAALKVLENE